VTRALAALVVLAVPLAAAPVPKEKPKDAAPNYYPTKKGSRWVYKVGETTMATVVTAVEEKDGAKLLTVDTVVNDKTVATERLSVSDKGVFRTHINKAAIEPPVCILKSPVKAGEAWEVASKIQDQATVGTFTVVGVEAVTVPAGAFKAVVVDGPDFEIAGTKTGVKYWFAPDVGLVKIAYTIAGTAAVLELKDFTPGK
jgi:hypothetical protein